MIVFEYVLWHCLFRKRCCTNCKLLGATVTVLTTVFIGKARIWVECVVVFNVIILGVSQYNSSFSGSVCLDSGLLATGSWQQTSTQTSTDTILKYFQVKKKNTRLIASNNFFYVTYLLYGFCGNQQASAAVFPTGMLHHVNGIADIP